MTDPKGDRSKSPSQQADPDLFLRVVERRPGGLVLRGAKVHQTGCLNSHWLVVMPGGRLTPAEADYAVCCALPVDSPGLTYIYGRQSCDTRVMEGAASDVDLGNAQFGGQVGIPLTPSTAEIPQNRLLKRSVALPSLNARIYDTRRSFGAAE